jgi:dTDP-4-dehydrorhamnose reductase
VTSAVRVLVTGASGQVGRALARTVPAAGVLARFVSRQELDICNRAAVAGAIADFGPDAVVNCAAYTAVDRAESDRAAAHAANAEAPEIISSALVECGRGRLIQLSTDFVFNGRASSPYAPDAETDPLSVYGSTKLAGERAALAALGSRATVLRTSWVYAGQGSNFVLTMLRLLRERGAVRVVADQIGSPTSAPSVARAVWASVLQREVQGIVHWSDAGVASWYDFAVAISEEAAARGLLSGELRVEPIATSDYPTPARRPSYSVLDKASSVQALGVAPRHWRVELRSVLEEIARA